MTTTLPLIDQPATQRQNRALGTLEVRCDNKRLTLPLKGVEIQAKVADRLAHVTMNETFQNPHNEHLEAVYIFPLSGGCAVSSFKLKVGDRIIEGVVNEREQARQEYAQAIQDGKRAALLEQERDDVFTVQVGNLPPGEEVTVILTYSEKLAYFENGTTEIRLPLVVSDRYIPGQALERDSVGEGVAPDTDQVPDASRITPPRLAPGVDPKVALKLSVVLAGGQGVEDLSCSQHATKLAMGQNETTVALSQEKELLNRDFVLRWRLAGDEVRSNFLVVPSGKDKKQNFAMLSLIPPRNIEIASAPRDVIFVLDRSGSMQGVKMTSAARACAHLLSTLGPSDRFAIQAFDTVVEWMPPSATSGATGGPNAHFVDADVAGIEEGAKYLRTVTARGGTEISGAISDAISEMNARSQSSGRQPVVVVITDGAVGNESGVFKLIQGKLRDIRVFTVGIDTAVNEGFLRRLASLGGGTATFVEPTSAIEAALEQVSREIGTPLIQNLSLEDLGCGLDFDSLAPNRIADMFEGRAVTVFFRVSRKDVSAGKALKIKGNYPDGTPFSMEVTPEKSDIAALPQLWAKERITDLEDAYRVATGEQQKSLRQKIVDIAVEHGILTKFTAFVVVDHSEIVNKDGQVRKVVQPVHDAALWDMKSGMSGAYGPAPQAMPMFQQAAPLNLAQSISRAKNQCAEFGAADSWGAAPSAAAPAPGSSPYRHLAPGQPASDQAVTGGWQSPSAPSAPPQPSQAPGSGGSAFDALSKKAKDLLGSVSGWGAKQAQEPSSAMQQAQVTRKPDPAFPKLRSSVDALIQALKDAIDEIKGGNLPGAASLEKKRLELIELLTNYEHASELPVLQKYLRSDLIKLIAAIDGATSVSNKLKELAKTQEKSLQAIADEMSDHANASVHQPFWHSAV